MSRPMAVVGITAFLSLILLSTLSLSFAVVLLIAFAVLSAVTLIISKTRKTVLIPAVCITVSAACVLSIVTTQCFYKPILKYAGDNVAVKGYIADSPSVTDGKYYYTIKTSEVNGEKVKTKIRFSTKAYTDLDAYDEVTINGKVYVLGENNEESHKYYKSKQTYLGIYTYKDIEVLKPEKLPLYYYIIQLRDNIKTAISEKLDGEVGGLITALLLGDKSEISEQTKTNFKIDGVSHLMAVSGLHLSVLSSFLYELLKKTRIPRQISAGFSSAFVILFVALTGFSPSAVRAGVMMLIFYLGAMTKREPDSVNSLGTAIFIMCAINPFAVMDYGLLLSFFATLGIIMLYEKLFDFSKMYVNKISFTPVRKIVTAIVSIVAVTLCSTVFTLPVMILCIGCLSVISPLSNVLLVNGASVGMITGGIGALLSIIPGFNWLSYPFMFIAGLSSKYIIWCSGLLAKIPFALISTDAGFVRIYLAGMLIIATVAIILKAKASVKLTAFTSLTMVIVLLTSIFSYQIANRDVFNICVVDVGNGSSVLLTKNGYSALVGCGGDYFAQYNIKKAMNITSKAELELLVVPRIQGTESSCAEEIIKDTELKSIILPIDSELPSDKNTLKTSASKITMFNGITAEYINNEIGSAVFVKDGQTKILIIFYSATDLSRLPEEWLDAQVLISRSGVPENYDKYGFETVIMSCDEEKSKSIIKNIDKDGINTLATGGSGDIILSSRGNGEFKVRRGS